MQTRQESYLKQAPPLTTEWETKCASQRRARIKQTMVNMELPIPVDIASELPDRIISPQKINGIPVLMSVWLICYQDIGYVI